MEAPTSSFADRFTAAMFAYNKAHGTPCSIDMLFLVFLQQVEQFGHFRLGPITIDVRVVEEAFARAHAGKRPEQLADDYVRFSNLLMREVRKGEGRLDERHYLYAFMNCKEGIPGRVFSELGVTADQVEAYLRQPPEPLNAAEHDRLMTPEEVAEYLHVHIQTVRGWIRAGKLPARRLSGMRAVRIRHSDAAAMLEPLGRGRSEGEEL